MDDHQAAATLEELHQVLALLADLDVPRLLRVQDEHVRLVELLLGRKFERAVGLGATFIEHRHPVLQKLREIMRAGAVGFRAGTDENAQRLRRKRRGQRAKGKETERSEDEAFHGWRNGRQNQRKL